MVLDSLYVSNCRNIGEAGFEADNELTVIAGDNGQGKTSLLECIFLLTGSKSFRGAKDMDLVRMGATRGLIRGKTRSNHRESDIEITVENGSQGKRGRFARVNQVEYGRASEIAGIFTAVVFEPNHLSLVKAGPEGRRRFLDAALCQLYPNYLGILRRFHRALTQKNALLRKYGETRDADGMLDAFDAELAASGEEMMRRRGDYLKTAGPSAENFYSELSSGAEELTLSYRPCAGPGELGEKLARVRGSDIRAGFSTAGPHREDFEVLVKEKSARTYGSQGQQRSAVLALKLAEAEVAKQVTGEQPVLLLDDVLSELDENRQAYLLSRMSGKQSFVTCCDASVFDRVKGKIIRIQDGNVIL